MCQCIRRSWTTLLNIVVGDCRSRHAFLDMFKLWKHNNEFENYFHELLWMLICNGVVIHVSPSKIIACFMDRSSNPDGGITKFYYVDG